MDSGASSAGTNPCQHRFASCLLVCTPWLGLAARTRRDTWLDMETLEQQTRLNSTGGGTLDRSNTGPGDNHSPVESN